MVCFPLIDKLLNIVIVNSILLIAIKLITIEMRFVTCILNVVEIKETRLILKYLWKFDKNKW